MVPTKWNVPPAEVVDLGDGTYSITRDARSVFSSLESLENRVKQDAAEFCQANQLSHEVISLDSDDVSFFADEGFSQVKLVFRAWPNANPHASASPSTNRTYPVAVPIAPAMNSSTPSPQGPSATDRMYEDLVKLDDLLKKGILTEEEFATEKQKVLNRYQ